MRTTIQTWLALSIALVLATSLAADTNSKEERKAKTPPPDISAGNLVGETASTLKIERALEEPAELEVVEAPLTDVIEYLKVKHDIEIQLDNHCLQEAGVATDTQITRSLRNLSLRSALNLVLRDIGLDFVIRDEVLLITTKETAGKLLETRIYWVHDLMDAEGKYDPIMEVITAAVAPGSWESKESHVSVVGFPPARSLIITQNRAAQDEICQLLSTLRKVRDMDPQPAAADKGD